MEHTYVLPLRYACFPNDDQLHAHLPLGMCKCSFLEARREQLRSEMLMNSGGYCAFFSRKQITLGRYRLRRVSVGRLRPSKRTLMARGSTSPLGDTHIRPLPKSCPPLRGSACMHNGMMILALARRIDAHHASELLKRAITSPRRPSSKTLHNPQGAIWASANCTSLGRHHKKGRISSVLHQAQQVSAKRGSTILA